MKKLSLISCLLSVISAYGQAPVISDFSPKTGVAGSTITLTGSGFDSSPANNIVYFGTLPATVLSSGPTQLEVEVPVGTKAAKITIVNTSNNLLGESSLNFYPTFNGGTRIIPASFLPHQDLDVDNVARTVRMADIDGDGWLDIVAATNPEISVFRNLAIGGKLSSNSFDVKIDLPVQYPSFGGNSNDVSIADLDNDGKPDLYFSLDINQQFAPFSGAIGIYRNTSTPGNISFDPITFIGTSIRSSFVAHGDFDGDGRQELLAAHAASCGSAGLTYFVVFQNLSSPGTLSFGPQVDLSNTTGACTYERILVTDINGDNKLDIGVQRSFEAKMSLILNQSSSTGIINSSTFDLSPNLINGSSTIAFSDFDGDRLPELITHNEAVGTGIALRPNISTTLSLNFSDSITFFTNQSVEGETAIADINGDGKKDIVVTSDTNQDWISIMENSFSGSWDETSFKQPVRLKTNVGFSKTLDVGDLNHDGKPDIITSNQLNFISILENAIQFPPQISDVSAYQSQIGETITITGQHFSSTPSDNKVRFGNILANVISSSTTDLVVEVPLGAQYDYITVGVGLYTAISAKKFSTVIGPGNTFDANSFEDPVVIATAGDINDLIVGDLDNDGKLDLLVRDGSSMLILKNESAPNVLEASSFQVVPSTVSLFVQPGQLMDLNGDNYLDLFTQSAVYFNSSESSSEPIEFQDRTALQTGNSPSFTLTDFNRDGILDNVQTWASASDVLINEGVYNYAPFATTCCSDPNLPFLPWERLPKSANGGSIAAADFDGDGLPDIAASNPSSDNVSFFRNLGSTDIIQVTDFSVAQNISVGDGPTQIQVGDLDLDGKTDLAIINQNDNSVSVLHNQSTPGTVGFDLYTYAISASPRLLRLADLDGDSKPEIITVNAWNSSVGATQSVLKNNTASMDASSFAIEQLYTRTNNAVPSDFEIADLDDDGKVDLILTSTNPDELLIMKNLIQNSATITITSQPMDQLVCVGDIVTFNIDAEGASNMSYKWQEDQGSGYADILTGGMFAGANTATLTISGVSALQDQSHYRCVVSGNFAPDITSDFAILQVNAIPNAPAISNGTGCVNTSVELSASGSVDGNYRWYSDPVGGSFITGEFNSTFTTPLLSTTTSYFVAIENNGCEGPRTEVVAEILESVTITSQPTSITVSLGETTTFSIAASGSDLNYQWQKEGVDLVGEISTSLVLSDVSSSAVGGYSCVVSNSCGSLVSQSADLTLVPELTSGYTIMDLDNGKEVIDGEQLAIDSEVAIGETINRTFEIDNTGHVDIVIHSILISGDPIFSALNVPQQVLAGTSESFVITANSSTSGTFTGAITLSTNVGDFSFSVQMEFVESTASKSFLVYDVRQNVQIENNQEAVIDFGVSNVGEPLTRAFEIDNTGLSDINNIEIKTSGASIFSISNIPSQIMQGSSGIFEVEANSAVEGVFETDVIIEVEDVGNMSFGITVEFLSVPSAIDSTLVVYNAVSPNGDGRHDFLKIENIEFYPENSIQIYNRWGGKVYEAANYDNQSTRFEGSGNVNGTRQLSEGTYYYVIKTSSIALSGFLVLKR